ncbi:DNA-binding MarR family transcriptional regulator [Frondihabitans sp. PhB188]|uniref:MarR family winged helix-turn-helix transcriptional regulator n=1 Tax=Frondihabitans sp. PhB188 TaxID=2485200 RepID=UPI000F480F58|nr:MarR family transcriptional regulator [Frondihabitans sp. PhB188]ROQ41040.1 DNA-binding MarR family transcriptional regulator [Frondihabitans sp. PhB188]
MTTATPLLDEQICFALYSASRALTSRYRELLEPLGVTYPQYLALLVLWEDGPVTVGHLGDRLQLDSGTLSPLLRRLQAAGFVTRTRTEGDERVVEVALTASGEALRAKTAPIQAGICEATGLDPDDLVALQKQIASVAAHVRAA